MLLIILVTVVFYSSIDHIQSENTCNGLYSNFYEHLASKTAYRYVANYNTNPIEFNGNYS